MRRVCLAAALLGFGSLGASAAGKSKNLYAVTHVDFAAGGAVLAEMTDLIRVFEADSQKEPGVIRFEVLQQDGHPNHFTFYEVWKTRRAFDAHLAAPHTRQFREKIQPRLGSPFRERLHRPL